MNGKPCPECGHARSYRLADRRRKCRRCGHRYTWKPVWESIALAAPLKRRLLRQFVIGVPAYRLRGHSGVSAKAHERFNRLLRAACAREGGIDRSLTGAEVAMRGAPDAPASAIAFTVSVRGGRIVAAAGPSSTVSRQRIERLAVDGPLEFVTPDQARVLLPLRSGRIVCVAPPSGRPKPSDHNPLLRFCHFAVEWLRPYGAIPREYFHLYIGEVCYRFNHRDEDFEARLRHLLQAQSIQSLRPLLVRNG